jgi:hypothetical protein
VTRARVPAVAVGCAVSLKRGEPHRWLERVGVASGGRVVRLSDSRTLSGSASSYFGGVAHRLFRCPDHGYLAVSDNEIVDAARKARGRRVGHVLAIKRVTADDLDAGA